jgi:hypothetical protein
VKRSDLTMTWAFLTLILSVVFGIAADSATGFDVLTRRATALGFAVLTLYYLIQTVRRSNDDD